MDSLFFQSSKSIKLITKSLQPSGANLIAVRDYPTFPWETIWKLAFSNMLGNKLMDFQWRLAHHILYTGKRIKDWGMGDGICPCEQCNEIETISHIFWECPKAKTVLIWVEKIFHRLAGDNSSFNMKLYLFGFPCVDFPQIVFNRIWFIFCITKFAIWKSRCLHIFEDQAQTGTALLSIIAKEIKTRVEADFSRLTKHQFSKLWTSGTSFVKIKKDKLHINLKTNVS